MSLLPAYRIATVELGSGWEASPYAKNTERYGGLVEVHSRSWRATDKRVSVKLVSINHPRPMRPRLKDMAFTMVRDILWAQHLEGGSVAELKLPMGEDSAEADALVVHATVRPAPLLGVVPVPFTQGVVVVGAYWRNGEGWIRRWAKANDYMYVGVAAMEHGDLVRDWVPRRVTYVKP